MDLIPKRNSNPLPSPTSRERKGAPLSLRRKKKEQEKKEKSKGRERWTLEEWMVVPLREYKVVPNFSELESSPQIIRNASKLYCFTCLWNESIVEVILRRTEVSLYHYWLHLAIRIYCHQLKVVSPKDAWLLPSSVFQGHTMTYFKWVALFCECAVDRDTWFILSGNFRKYMKPGDHIAADEKQQRCRARENPMVSQVRGKLNAPVGLWYFQVCCRSARGDPYVLSFRPAKVIKGDKSLVHWTEWLFAHKGKDDPFPATFSDSLYVSEDTVNEFIVQKIIFSFSIPQNRFDAIQRKLRPFVTHFGDYALAWCQQRGLLMTMVYDPELNERKVVLSNGYSLQPVRSIQRYKIPKEVLSSYVMNGLLPVTPPSREACLASILRFVEEVSPSDQGKVFFVLFFYFFY